ncbi:helix-turn-helix domain-containing protein [Salinisphaera sp. Q1T1-3]|uniref:helix-turn-helix domain-containing protein n=1 Tax=Salinisphaera sp. Q1T1-3 TaxID=2321229 RepID=UPI000E738418|nr:helix-turn-helix domain-containing protein [Salinisphaera sp. Q1T1-3]RJS93561.1 MerR family transcriptional regulator [Salinisphaera sp. Q1T1-3]
MQRIDIGDVVRRSGVPASTLRYYESKNLLSPAGRAGLRRLFSEDVFERLALISLGQRAGFSLDEIAAMFDAKGQTAIDHEQLRMKADELDETIRQLCAMRDGLRHAASCPASTHMECPTFRRLIRLASADRVRKQR